MKLLLGDIGGTHTRLALAEPGRFPDEVTCYRNSDIPDLVSLLGGYLHAQNTAGAKVQIHLAVAAPVLGDTVELTNFQRRLSALDLRRDLGVTAVRFVNDYTATAQALPYLGGHDRVQLGGGQPVPDTAMGVLGPGTGLGVSGLVPYGERWAPIIGEGGHCTLAATSMVEFSVISKIAEQTGHVSAERIVSGPGLVLLYQTLCGIRGVTPACDAPARVSAAAQDGSDAVAREALALFFAFLGDVAGNLALTLGARGGIYLAGGILPQLIGAAMASTLRKRFEAKGRFRRYLRDVPMFIITHRYPALLGLVHPTPDK
ncbi:MAG: glucokinase [Gammaproteobacteria bacterium]|nr:glucokinase [Gammaproteobacteria bacterium]